MALTLPTDTLPTVPSAARPDQPPDPAPLAPPAVRRAAALVLVEAAGLAVLAVVVLVKTVTGSPSDRTASLLEVAMAGAAAVVLVLLARALARVAGWSRSPVVVLELLAVPVGVSLAFQAGLWAYGGPVLLLAGGVLYLLATPEARLAFLDR